MSSAAVGRDRATRGLFERWQRDKDPRARECLVERYLPLARTLAARYRGRGGEPFDDLLQVASLGLLKALDRFDPDRGAAFSSFAVPTILGELKRHFRDTGWSAHVPRGAQELALKVQESEQAVSPRLGRSPTAAELAQYMEVTVEQVTRRAGGRGGSPRRLAAAAARRARWRVAVARPTCSARTILASSRSTRA